MTGYRIDGDGVLVGSIYVRGVAPSGERIVTEPPPTFSRTERARWDGSGWTVEPIPDPGDGNVWDDDAGAWVQPTDPELSPIERLVALEDQMRGTHDRVDAVHDTLNSEDARKVADAVRG